ncbi:MAG TPA: phosphatase PAP2 family protein [Cytophaga sp.]|jgi:hypothetical protein|nr:phosphatase PAP2 family protein [Cytophaga sp.]
MNDRLQFDIEKSKIRILSLILISILYLIVSYILIGSKPEQFILVALVLILYVLSDATRRFITAFSVFIIYWIIFDYLKAIPNFEFNDVVISDIYNLDKKLFGIRENGTLLTLNEYWSTHGTVFLDLLCGFFYINWVPIPLLFACYLFNTNKREFLYFALTFLLVNIVGFVIYYIVPAAPPWYIQEYGFQFTPLIQSSPAGLSKFEAITGIPIFQSIYSKGSNVFAAMPSLHSAYPFIVLVFSIRNSLKWMSVFVAVISLGIWFAAVYTSHHYVLDVLAGITCASFSIILFFYVILKITFIREGIIHWEEAIRKS